MCFSTYFLSQTHTFSSMMYRLVSGCVFYLLSILETHNMCFFTYYLVSYTHFLFHDVSIRFPGVLFCFIFILKTHNMCFSTYFFSHTHTFSSMMYRLVSGCVFLPVFRFIIYNNVIIRHFLYGCNGIGIRELKFTIR